MVRKVLPGSINVAAACQRKEDTGFTQIPSSTHSEQAWHQSGGDTVGFDSSVGQCFFYDGEGSLILQCCVAWSQFSFPCARHAEFARASTEMNLEGGTCAVPLLLESCGGQVQWYARCDPKQVLQEVGRFSWSTSQHESAPSREIALEVFAFNPSLDKPVWAEVLSNRFVDGPEKARPERFWRTPLKASSAELHQNSHRCKGILLILGLTAQCLWTLVGSLSQRLYQLRRCQQRGRLSNRTLHFHAFSRAPGPYILCSFFPVLQPFLPPLWTLQCLLEACCNPLKEWKAGCGFAERLHPVAGQSIGITDGGECWWTLWLWNGQLRWSHCKSLR